MNVQPLLTAIKIILLSFTFLKATRD